MYLQRKQYLLQWQSKKLKPFNGNEEGEHGIETAMTDDGDYVIYKSLSAVSREIHKAKQIDPTKRYRYKKLMDFAGTWSDQENKNDSDNFMSVN